MPTQRQLRVNNLLQEEISGILRTEIHDPDIGFVTITGVEVTADLREARVYASVLGDEDEVHQTMAALHRARTSIRSALGDCIQLKYLPELTFELDDTARHAQRIEALISKFEREVEQTAGPSLQSIAEEAERNFGATVRQIAQLLTQGRPTAIFIHRDPDGDALGSGLALSLALQQLAQSVPVVCPDPVPSRYQFLPATDRVTNEVPQRFEVAVILDAGDRSQLGELASAAEQAEVVVWIDHHQTNQGGADIDYLDPTAAATALLLRPLIDTMGATVTPDIATCLYTAVATDTGFFTFENSCAGALAAAAELVQNGADPHGIATAARKQYRMAVLRLRGRVLTSLSTYEAGRIACAELTPGDFAIAGAEPEDTEGIIELLKTLTGSQVQVLLKAVSHDRWRVSLRSPVIDVAALAAQFGGGGHRAAAGCTMIGALPEVRARLLKAVASMLLEER